MMIEIESFDDERLEAYRNLKDRQLAAMGDLFIAEGEHVTRRLLGSTTHETVSVLTETGKAAAIAPLVPDHVPLYVAPAKVVSQVIGFDFHRNMLAVGRRPRDVTLDSLMHHPPRHSRGRLLLVCEQMLNDENLGSIMRIAAGFGVNGLILGPRSCDPYWRRAIRVSMGNVFELPVYRSDDLLADIRRLREQWGVKVIASVLDETAQPLEQSHRETAAAGEATKGLAIVLGSESQGLSTQAISACDQRVTIPMQGGTDSLNVAMAAAVFLYHYTRVV